VIAPNQYRLCSNCQRLRKTVSWAEENRASGGRRDRRAVSPGGGGRGFGEVGAALRQKVNEVENFSRDAFMRKGSFNEIMKDLKDRIGAGHDDLKDWLEDRVEGRHEDLASYLPTILRTWHAGSLKLQMTMAPTRGRLMAMVMGYTLIYELLLAPYRDLKFNLLEIGLQTRPETDHTACRPVTNAPSVKMWREYFTKATSTRSIFPISVHIKATALRSFRSIADALNRRSRTQAASCSTRPRTRPCNRAPAGEACVGGRRCGN